MTRRIAVQIAIGVAVLAIAAVVIGVVVSQHHAAAARVATSTHLGPKNMASGGVLLTGKDGTISAVRTPAVKIGRSIPSSAAAHPGSVSIVEYVDYQCPICLEFEQTNLANTASLVAAGSATLEIHPVSILDRSSSGTRYSSRAANAGACVANFDPDSFLNVTAALYEYQPAEGTRGLSNSQILTVLAKGGASSAAISNCVNSETYRDWVTATTNSVASSNFAHVAAHPVAFQGTPTVFVNGVQYPGSITDESAFAAFVADQAKG